MVVDNVYVCRLRAIVAMVGSIPHLGIANRMEQYLAGTIVDENFVDSQRLAMYYLESGVDW